VNLGVPVALRQINGDATSWPMRSMKECDSGYTTGVINVTRSAVHAA
jgi:hypothetical protein